MSSTTGEKIVNAAQAAALLQPHMPTKNAVAWLENDRAHEPVIAFARMNGEFMYRETDLLAFIGHFMEPSPIHRNQERREANNRRAGVERRIALETYLRQGVERRSHSALDRRLRGGIDRRGASAAAG
jgi:hypothetical protein